MPTQIKPCPFCGSEISTQNFDDDRGHKDDYSAVYLMCPSCGAGMGIDEEELPEIFAAAVINKWNNRYR